MGDAVAIPVERRPLGIFQATSVVMAATLTSAVFGLAREVLIAHHFGATTETDAYFFAFALMVGLPEFLLGAMMAGLIPIYLRAKKEGDSTEFVSTVINVYLLFLLAAAVAILVSAPWISKAIASGLDGEGQQLVAQFIWILSPTILMAGLWGLLKSILDAERQFFVSNVSRVFFSLGIIAAVLVLAPRVGIYSLPVGILIASVLQLAWVIYWISKIGIGYRLRIDLKDPRFRRFLALLGPGVAGGIIGAMLPVIDASMASHLSTGSIASLGYAARPMGLVTRVAVFTFVTALLPTLTWKALHSDKEAFRATIIRTIRILVAVTTPCSILLAVLRVPIIQLLFERGKFDADATAATSAVFAGLVLGLMPMAVAVMLATAFKSLEDTKTPALFGAGSNLISKVGFNLLLIAPLGVLGLALATSLQYVVSGLILLWILRRRLGGVGVGSLGTLFFRVMIASACAAGPAYFLVTNGSLPAWAILSAGIGLGTIVYLGMATLLQIREMSVVWDVLETVRGKVGLGGHG